MKKYEINGVVNYAHCYSLEIDAENKKEATKIAKGKMDPLVIDPQMGEFQNYIMDKPIEIINGSTDSST